MTRSIRRAAMLGIATLGTALWASAVSATVTFDFKNAQGSYDAGTYQSFNLDSTDKSSQVTVYGGHLDSTGSGFSKVEGAEAKVWNGAGLGVSFAGQNDSPNNGTHQIDNAGGGSDFVVLDFGQKVTLSQINRAAYGGGGVGTDTDLSFLAYTASTSVSGILGGLNEGSFTSLNSGFSATGSKVASNIWIVAANVTGQTDDAFKLTSIKVDVPTAGSVPEPATWGTMIIGLGAVGAGLRRRKAASLLAA